MVSGAVVCVELLVMVVFLSMSRFLGSLVMYGFLVMYARRDVRLLVMYSGAGMPNHSG